MKNILVTGGAGFIGSNLSERLFKDKSVRRVICVDNLDPAYPVKFKKGNLALLIGNKKFRYYKTDIRNLAGLRKVFKKEKIDAVVHLAAKTDTRTSVTEPLEYLEVNVRGTLNLLELSREFKVKKFVFISSSSIYGNTKVKPPFNESVVTDFPLAPYGATKKAGEVLAHTYFFNHGLSIACIRLFNVYGERMRPGPVLYTWVDNIFKGRPVKVSGAGVRRRDFTYVSDVVDGIIRALKTPMGYEIFNIASSSPASLNDLLRVVRKIVKKEFQVESRPSNKASIDVSHANISKATKVLGWRPKVGLEQGVSNFVRWFVKNRI